MDEIVDESQIVQLHAIRQVKELTVPDDSTTIRLDLSRWNVGPRNNDDITDAKSVLEYFSNVARANLLQETPAGQKLQSILSLVNAGTHTDVPAVDTVAFEHASQVNALIGNFPIPRDDSEDWLVSVREQLATAAYTYVPIFNIWDSISLIYTLCVEPVESSLQAELHSYQFRSMVKILSRLWDSEMRHMVPSTVAATWSELPAHPDSKSLTICFATTCVGKRDEKTAMAATRYEFARSLITGLDIIRSRSFSICSRYYPGNCPEWITFIVVCRRRGRFYSVCQNTSTQRMYKFCQYCQQLADALGKMGITVVDFCEESFLGDGEVINVPPEIGFSYRKLLSFSAISSRY